jgi:hypothetical protein
MTNVAEPTIYLQSRRATQMLLLGRDDVNPSDVMERSDEMQLRSIAAGMVLKAIRRYSPQTLIDLRDNVDDSTGDPTNLMAWAARWRLASAWVYYWAANQRDFWAANGNDAESLEIVFAIPHSVFRFERWKTVDEPDDLAPIAAQPTDESLTEFLAKAERHFKARVRYLEDLGYRRAQSKPRLQEHSEWFVRYQVLQHSFATVSKTVGQHSVTVRDAVREFASLVDLGLRPPTKGGRPRK